MGKTRVVRVKGQTWERVRHWALEESVRAGRVVHTAEAVDILIEKALAKKK